MTAVASTGIYRAARIADEAIGNIAEGTQTAVVAAGQAGSQLITSAGETVGNLADGTQTVAIRAGQAVNSVSRSLFQSATTNTGSANIGANSDLYDLPPNNVWIVNPNASKVVEFPISNRVENLEAMEKDFFDLIDKIYDSTI